MPDLYLSPADYATLCEALNQAAADLEHANRIISNGHAAEQAKRMRVVLAKLYDQAGIPLIRKGPR